MNFKLDKLDDNANTEFSKKFCKSCYDMLNTSAGNEFIKYVDEIFLKGIVVQNDNIVESALREGERNFIRRMIQAKNIHVNNIKPKDV